MKDLLKNLREHLSALIEEIDNYTHANSEDIIISKEDFKYLKHERASSNNFRSEIFSYKNEIYFKLNMRDIYERSLYESIMEGKLDSLILLKLNKKINYLNYEIKYEIESKQNTLLRKNIDLIKVD